MILQVQHLASGALLGLSSGLAPGPLMTLVISETLTHGFRSGVRVALAPLVTDLPIVVLSLLLLAKLSDSHLILGLISLVGSMVILKMGMANFRPRPVGAGTVAAAPRSLSKGVLVNFLSPHPYLFWISVGGPLVEKVRAESLWAALGFVFLFYVALIGAKIGLALLTARSGRFLTGRVYRLTLQGLGVLLCVLGLGLAWDGVLLLGGSI